MAAPQTGAAAGMNPADQMWLDPASRNVTSCVNLLSMQRLGCPFKTIPSAKVKKSLKKDIDFCRNEGITFT